VLQRAQFVHDEIEREATTKRGAIAAIFESSTVKPKASSPSRAASEKDGGS